MQVNWLIWTTLVAAAAVGLAVLVRTRWLQSHTLTKCVVLSVVLHAVLAMICGLLAGFAPASWGSSDEGPMTMMMVVAEEAGDDAITQDAAAARRSEEPVATPVAESLADQRDADTPSPAVPLVEADAAAVPADVVPLLPQGMEADPQPSAHELPVAYADRQAVRRAAVAAARGGSEATEQAVQRALEWLAANQASDGRWNAARHGAGMERAVHGRQHHGSGMKSDHGVTGLALLAFLGAGTTHQTGKHADCVHRGIRFLVDRQRADGSLAGDAEFFAALYCHGMAGLALGECAAMTGDAALRGSLEKAVNYTLSMQHPTTGGWRYAAGDKGDTSQLGWQVMLLEAAVQAGVAPHGIDLARGRARRFLQSVSSGVAGGLAGYRPGERPTMAMTAEALVCRMFLGISPGHPSATEALDLLSRSLPERSSPNAYAWYYATLASFHAGGPQWDRWNGHLQSALLPLQRLDESPLHGSWDPDPVWGGHGGRVYATAMAAMTLEVYYRHLPMHLRHAGLAAR